MGLLLIQLFHIHHPKMELKGIIANNPLFNFPNGCKNTAKFQAEKIFRKRRKVSFHFTFSLLALNISFIETNLFCFGTKCPIPFLLSVRSLEECSDKILAQKKYLSTILPMHLPFGEQNFHAKSFCVIRLCGKIKIGNR